MNVSYNNKPAIMRRNGQVVLGEIAQKQRFSVDLSTTDKWETLVLGKHALQIVARAGNYIDSDKSDPIEFEVPLEYLCFTAEEAGSTVAMAVNGTPTKDQAFETSTDGTNWSVFTPGTTTITLANAGDKVYFRGDNTTVSESNSTYYKFVMSGEIAASGNIMSLLDTTCKSTTISNNYCYYRMFNGCTSLTMAPALPATTLASNCYRDMFYNCTSLTTAHELPATALTSGCYNSMFQGCTSLTTAPELPATMLAGLCYRNMFYGCTSLKISATQTGEYTTAWRIPSTGEIASEQLYWNTDMLKNTGGTFIANPSINTTYYIAG